jgi:serine/threonine protein kinase
MMEAGMLLDGRYRLKWRLGQGNFGEVWRATDEQDGQDVAIKVMVSELSDRVAYERFAREKEIVASLRHPGIVRVHSSGWHGSQMYIVMELLEGPGDLAKVMNANDRKISVALSVHLAIQVADALTAVHARDIIHRDIKPANLFVQAGNELKILDFGIARDYNLATITAPNTAVGTPAYMAPELWEGERATEQSDLYALGCVLYEMLTGRPPFSGESGLGRLYAEHKNLLPGPPSSRREDIPSALDHLVLRLLAKIAIGRPLSAAEVASLLRQIERSAEREPRERPAQAIPPGTVPTRTGPVRPGPAWMPALSATPAPPVRGSATIACAAVPKGQLEVFLLDGTGIRQRRVWPGSGPAAWQAVQMPKGGVSAIAAGSHDEEHAELAAVVGDTVWHKQWMNGQSSGWDAMPPLLADIVDVAFVSMIPSHLDAFALDATGRIQYCEYPEYGRWSQWRDLDSPGGETVTALAAGSSTREQRDLFVIGGGAVWHRSFSRADDFFADWGPWQHVPLPGGHALDLACTSSQTGHLALFVLGEGGGVYHQSRSAREGWARWSSLSAPDNRWVTTISAGWYSDSGQAALFALTGEGGVHCAWRRPGDSGLAGWTWHDLTP